MKNRSCRCAKLVVAVIVLSLLNSIYGQCFVFASRSVDTAEEASILNAVSEVPMPGSVPSMVSALDGEELLEAEDEAFLDETIDPAFIGTGPVWVSNGGNVYKTNADKSFLTPDGKEFPSDYTYYDGWYYYDLGGAAGYGNLGDIYESCHPSGLYRSRTKLKPFTRLQSAFLVDTVLRRDIVTFDNGCLYYINNRTSPDQCAGIIFCYRISFPKDDDPSYVKKTLVYLKEFHNRQDYLKAVKNEENYDDLKSHFDDKYESEYPLLAGSRSVHVPGVPYNPLTEEENEQQKAYLLELGRESREACEQNGGHDFEVVKKNYDDYVRFTYTCKNCGYEYMEREYLHTHNYTWQTIVAPTPTTRGYQRCMCTKCDSIKDGTGITYIYPTGVPKFDKSSVRLKVGESVDLIYKIDAAATTNTVEKNDDTLFENEHEFEAFVDEAIDLSFPLVWTVSDESVATVADGHVTAVGKGETTIMAECDGRRAFCSVVVEGIKVTFDGNGGTVLGNTVQEYEKGDAYGEMPTAVRAGHTFFGWYSGKNGGMKISSTRNMLSLSDHTLYARWESAETEQLVCTGQDGDTFYYDATLIANNRIASPIFKKELEDIGVFSITYGPNPKAAKKVANVNSKKGYLSSKLKDNVGTRDCTITIKKASGTYVVNVHVDKVFLAKPYIIYGEEPVNPVVVGTNLHIDAYFSKENSVALNKRNANVSEDGIVTPLRGGKKRIKVPYTILIGGTYVTRYVYVIDPKWKITYEKKKVNGQKIEKPLSVISGNPKKDKISMSKWIVNGYDAGTQWSVQNLTGKATISNDGVLQGIKPGVVVVKAVINNSRIMTREIIIN